MAQDRIFLHNGWCIETKVLEIREDAIVYESPETENAAETPTMAIHKDDVVLIEYYNGVVDVFTPPYENTVYHPDKYENKKIKLNNEKQDYRNFGSLNTLALCNADVSGFFEHLGPKKYFGIGVMAAYNFNPYATFPNLFINLLSNAKKHYDAGVFLNFYPTHFKKKNTFYYGVLFKYTEISFTRVQEQRTGSASTLLYSTANGSQRATIFTIGSHYKITPNFFIKTIFGIGGFNLRGIYKEQYNYVLNSNYNSTNPVEARFLLKVYFGLNAGYSF